MRMTTGALAVLVVVIVALSASNLMLWREVSRDRAQPVAVAPPQAESSKGPAPIPSAESPELAPYMGQLQRLMHKLQLSIAANHPELARFYLYETKELTGTICEEVPEYRGYPVALLIERTLSPRLESIEQALERKVPEAIEQAYEAAIGACNDCHRATQHGFIRIPIRAYDSPYLQAFERAEAP